MSTLKLQDGITKQIEEEVKLHADHTSDTILESYDFCQKDDKDLPLFEKRCSNCNFICMPRAIYKGPVLVTKCFECGEVFMVYDLDEAVLMKKMTKAEIKMMILHFNYLCESYY